MNIPPAMVIPLTMAYVRRDRVQATLGLLLYSFFFASVAPQQLLVPLNDLIAISKPLDGNVTVSVESGASHVKLWEDALKGRAYVSTESMPDTLYVEGLKL